MSEPIAALAWPLARLGEAVQALAAAAGLDPRPTELPPLPDDILAAAPPAAGAPSEQAGAARALQNERIGAWVAALGRCLFVEAEQVSSTCADLGRFLSSAGPTIVRTGSEEAPGFLLLLRGGRRRATLLGPDLGLVRAPIGAVAAVARAALVAPLRAGTDALLVEAGIPPRRRARASEALLAASVADRRLSGIWILRLPPGAGAMRQVRAAGLGARTAAYLLLYAARHGLWLFSWWLIGRAALEGRIDPGWFWAWALILLTLVPLTALTSWLRGVIAIGAGYLLKVRLLHGALRLGLDDVRSQGAGQLLARVLESRAVEGLALGGGFLVLMALTELGVAAAVLASGAGGAAHALLLLLWTTAVARLGWLYVRRRAEWTAARIAMTHDLVERMVGHRTLIAQEARARWHASEDEALQRYLDRCVALDRPRARLEALAPRGWLVLGLLGLGPAFVAGTATTARLAVGLGGVLLAEAALQKLAQGLSALAGAAIAWRQVAPLFRAAAREEPVGLPALATEDPVAQAESARRAGRPLLVAHGLVFGYERHGAPVLADVGLEVAPGDRILLEGPSGGGKSTLAAILCGLRQPDAGLLFLRGLDWRTIGHAGWRRFIAAAPQFHENHVLTGTLGFNLLMGRRWPALGEDFAEADAICRDLGLGPLLERMPSGLDQLVGETGWQLSHGERSRIFLARALLQRAPIVVLDESFAALDPENLERALRCVLARAGAVLVIAHP